MLLTYPFYFHDITSECYEWPQNINVTISCNFSEWDVLKKCRKENQWKSTVLNKAHFSSVMTKLWWYGWVCIWDDYTPLKFFKHKVRSSYTLYDGSAYHTNSFSWLEGALKWSNTMTPLTRDIATVYVKVPSCLTTSFKTF